MPFGLYLAASPGARWGILLPALPNIAAWSMRRLRIVPSLCFGTFMCMLGYIAGLVVASNQLQRL